MAGVQNWANVSKPAFGSLDLTCVHPSGSCNCSDAPTEDAVLHGSMWTGFMLGAIATVTRFVPATHRQVQQWRLEINGCQGTVVALRGTHIRRTNSVQTFNVGRP